MNQFLRTEPTLYPEEMINNDHLVACHRHTEGLFSLNLGVGHKKVTRGNARCVEAQDPKVPKERGIFLAHTEVSFQSGKESQYPHHEKYQTLLFTLTL